MLRIGLGLTRHCNLRCAHCLRDDVSAVTSLDPGLIGRVLDEATTLFGAFAVGLTGGEPLLHPDFPGVVDVLRARRTPWRLVTNGWHVPRALPVLAGYPPEVVVLSLSGADAAVHDAERGGGSFERVLLAVGVLRSRGIPAALSMIVDRRTRGQLSAAVDLADDLGLSWVDFVLPQPVPASVARGSDLPPAEWPAVRDAIHSLAAFRDDVTVTLAYGAPAPGEAACVCGPKALQRLYVDADGCLAVCGMLSGYGGNRAEVVADLHTHALAAALDGLGRRLRWLDAAGADGSAGPRTPGRRARAAGPEDALTLRDFPCLHCAGALGKLAWLSAHPDSPWTHLEEASCAHSLAC